MKLTLALLALIAYAHAIPVPKDDVRTQWATVATPIQTPTALVGSSQVDGKKDGKVTLHLDQRSQPSEPLKPIISVPSTEPVKQTVLQPVPVVEQPRQEPILSARNDIVPPIKSEEPIRSQPVGEISPEKTVLASRNEIIPSQTPQVVVPETPVRQIEPQVTPQVISEDQKKVIAVEEVIVPVIPPVPAIVVVPIAEKDIPQRVEQPVVPEVPQTVAQSKKVVSAPALEERSTPDGQTRPIVSDIPVREPDVAETKVVPKQGEGSQARNLKVDQAPVRAPIVVASKSKQAPIVGEEVRSEVKPQPQVVPQEPKLEGKNAIVSEVRPEPSRADVKPQVQEPQRVEERKAIEPAQENVVTPTRVQPVVPEQTVRNEPEQVEQRPVVSPQEVGVRAVQPIRVPEVREPVRRTETAPVESIRPAPVVPVAQSEQTSIPKTEARKETPKIQLPEEKLQ